MTRKVTSLAPKGTTEIDDLPFDFSASMTGTETISSATVTAITHSGTDASPSAVLSGSPVVSGRQVVQRITGGLAGVSYTLTCLATMSTGRKIAAVGVLPVVNLSV